MNNKDMIDKVKTKIAISNFNEKEGCSMMNKNISKMVASIALILSLSCGTVLATYSAIKYFKIKGIDDTGIQTAMENNYIQNIDMKYIEKEKVKFKVDYLMMDDINFDLVFNFITEDNVDNYEQIAVSGLKITDENNNQIYIDSEDYNIWSKNIAFTGGNWSLIEKDGHNLRQVLHLFSNEFPKSNRIIVSFDNVILYNVNKGNPITIEYKDNYKLEFDISNQLKERQSIEYVSDNPNIEKAILTNSGFAITTRPLVYSSNIMVKDENEKTYTLTTCHNILNIEKQNIDNIDKQVLIFNITQYNPTDTITLMLDNNTNITFLKK